MSYSGNVAYSNLFRYLAITLIAFASGYLFHLNSKSSNAAMAYGLLLFVLAIFCWQDYKRHLA